MVTRGASVLPSFNCSLFILSHPALNMTGTALNALNNAVNVAKMSRGVELCIISKSVD